MIPLGDSIRSRRTPYVTLGLIGLNLLVFAFELMLGPRLDEFVHRYGVTPRLITAALAGDPRVPEGVWLTLVTSQFLHAGWAHLLGNLLFLWIFGDNVEDRLGRLGYLLFYLLCGAGAALVQVLSAPRSPVPLIGASGAIAGVLGAYFVLYPRAWVTVLVPIFFVLLPFDVPAVLMLLLWFVGQLFSGLATLTQASATGGVAFWAHVGGFLIGMLVGALLPKAPARRPAGFGPAEPGTGRPVAARPAAPLARTVTTAFDLLGLLLLARFVLVLLPLELHGLPRLLAEIVLAASLPFVAPFAELAPLLRFGRLHVEVFTLLALAGYHLLGTALAWLLTSLARPSRA